MKIAGSADRPCHPLSGLLSGLRGRLRAGRAILFVLTVIVVPFFVASTANAGDYALLMDASLSMRGFYDSPRKALWLKTLRALDAGARQRWRFGNDVRPVADIVREAGPADQKTALDRALLAWLNAPDPVNDAVVVTDNVADTSDAEGWEAQNRFYAVLQGRLQGAQATPGAPGDGKLINGITLYPMVFPFSGTVYGPNDKPKSTFNGDRALAIYVLHRDPAAPSAAVVEQTVEGIIDEAGVEHDRVVVQPFGTDWQQAAPKLDLKILSANGATARLDADGTLAITDLPMNQGLTLTFNAGVTPGPNFALRDAALIARIDLPNDPELTSQRTIDAKVTPGSADFYPESERDFQVDFAIQPIDFFSGVSLMRQIELAFRTSTTIEGTITIAYRVDRQGVRFVGPEAQRWSYDGDAAALGGTNPQVHRQLYRMQDLIQGMLPVEGWERKVVERKVRIELRYSTAAVAMAMIAVLLVLAAVFFILRRLAQPRQFEVSTGFGRPQTIALGPFATIPVPSDDGHCRLLLTWLGFSLWVRARGGRLGGSSLLPSGGGRVRVTTPNGDSPDVHHFDIKGNAGTPVRRRSRDDYDPW